MKRYILSFAALLAGGMLYAQEDTRNAVVSVENDYNPTVVQVNKKSFTPTVEGKSNTKPAELIFSKQATPLSGFTSERDSKELLPAQEHSLPGYLRLGYGIRNDIDAKLGYNLKFNDRSHLRILGAFDGFKSDVDGIAGEWNSRMYNTAATADFTYDFRKFALGVTGDLNNRVFNYQRVNNMPDFSDRQRQANYNIGMKGASKFAGPFDFEVRAGYTHSLMGYSAGVDNAIKENHANAGLLMTYEIFDKKLHRIGMDVDFNLFMYNNLLKEAEYGYMNLLSMDFNPFVEMDFSGWKMMFGTKMNFRTANGPAFAIAPNITVDKSLTKRISFYANVTGGRKDNSFRTIEGITPYWGYANENRQLKPTYRIVDAVAGTRLTLEPLSFDVFAGYAYTKDDLMQSISYLYGEPVKEGPFFVGSQLVYITTIPSVLAYSGLGQANTSNVHVGSRIGYDCGGWLNISADARYDYWSCKERQLLMMKPEVTINANIEVRPIRNLAMKAGYNFTRYTRSDIPAVVDMTLTEIARINNRHDLHARISYSINRYFGAYIQGDNLLNSKYYDYAGYMTRGIRGLLGVTVSF